MALAKVIEREWSDGRHSFYQAKAQSRSGRIYEQTIIQDRWGPSRAVVYENVRQAAELDAAGRPHHRDFTSSGSAG